MKNICFLLLCALFFSSCQSQVNKEKDNFKITCYITTLQGTIEAYHIINDTFFSNRNLKSSKIYTNTYLKIRNPSKEILKENKKYGCGTCMDAADFKFILNYYGKSVAWEIQTGYDLPKEYKEYFDVLIKLYNDDFRKNK